ncbi:hypothetical protein BKI52_35470 [marine bacterium AO1-C]|nr:hypothetical protein BKI52_35470 [marine bacterium AO1-C]
MYQIKSTSFKGNYVVLKHGEQFSEVCYHNWKYNHAKASYHNQEIEIKANTDRKSFYDIIKNGVVTGNITIDCKSVSRIQVLDQHNKNQHFYLKAEGFWKHKYVLYFSNPQTPAIVLQSNNKRLTTYYDVKKVAATPLNIEIPTLIIYSVFALNLLSCYA